RGKAIEYPAKRTRMPVQLDWERHAGMDVAGMLLNRSCAPDLGVRENQWCARDFVALRGIAVGEELVSGDAMTGHALAVPLSWFCGSAACQGGIWPWSDCGVREQNAMWAAGCLRVGSALTTSAAAEVGG